MSQKHTPEPWTTANYEENETRLLGPVEDNGNKHWIGDIIGPLSNEVNAERIVACVNACAGIPNPELWIANMKELDQTGVPNVLKGLQQAKATIDALREEDKAIRELIGADENESTYDEVERRLSISDGCIQRSYTLRTERGEWLGQIIISSDGMYSSVTDWGNLSYAWRAFGKGDFRKFLAGLDNQYFGGKMYQGIIGVASGRNAQAQCYRYAEKILPALKKALLEDIKKFPNFKP